MDREKKIPMDKTSENLDELFRMLNAQGGQEEENLTEQIEDDMTDDGPLSARGTAMAEFAMMMRQYDALYEEYQRMEAEEQAAQEAEEGKIAEEENNHAGQAE